MNSLALITGGARSGRTELAETLAASFGKPVIYMPTVVAPGRGVGVLTEETELLRRIDYQKKRRPADWQTVEVSKNLDRVISKLPPAPLVCIIDCVSNYLNNVMTHDRRDLEETVRLFLQSINERQDVDFIVVTTEVTSGVNPDNVLARLYLDILSGLNKKLAAMSGAVWLCCVGLPLRLK